MGTALSLPIAVSADLLTDLARLRAHGRFELVATVAAEAPGVIGLNEFEPPARSILIAGNEFHGLTPEWLGVCDHRVTIPIAPGCDSLNVAVATGIFLHHMLR